MITLHFELRHLFFFFKLADAELWEDLIRVAKDISQSPDKDPQQLLKQNFILGKKWPTKRVHLRSEDWHQVPHTDS